MKEEKSWDVWPVTQSHSQGLCVENHAGQQVIQKMEWDDKHTKSVKFQSSKNEEQP